MIRFHQLAPLGLALGLSACVQVYPQSEKPTPSAPPAAAAAAAAKKPEAGPFKPWAEALKDTKPTDGYFKTHLKRDNTLFMEVRPDQLEQDFGLVMHISKGVGVFDVHQGLPLSDMQLMRWKRVGDKLYLVEMNPRFTAAEGSPMRASLDGNVGHSVVQAFKIESEEPETKALLIDVSGLILSDYTWLSEQLKWYYGNKPVMFDKDRSFVSKTMGFPKNVEIDAELTYRASDFPAAPGSWAGVSDVRSVPVGVRYSFVALPEKPMMPRLADDRVGFFMDAVRDFSRDRSTADSYQRYANRWRLEKKDPNAPLSEPVQPIVYYIDRTVPVEYRKYVKEGIEGWQKAFEAAGFKNAIIAMDAPDDPNWSAEDARYSTVRWTASHQMGYAIGPSQTDPRTGEILNADVLIASSWVNAWNSDYQELVGPNGMLARLERAHEAMANAPAYMRDRFCLAEMGRGHQLMVQHAALAALGVIAPGKEMPIEFLGDGIRDLIYHEVGHTLGLRHNFKASAAITAEQLNDPAYTRQHGVGVSVMDYLPVNISTNPKQQGDFFNKEVGSYDVWAIKWGYAPVYEQSKEAPFAFSGKLATTPEAELVGLRKVAEESTEPLHAFSTDEDTHLGGLAIDPSSTTNDLADPLWYARQRGELVSRVMPRLDASLIGEGEGYQRLRGAVNGMIFERFLALLPLTKYVGGVYFSRAHKGDPNSGAPFTPLPAARQREAVRTLITQGFAEGAFAVPAELQNRMPPNRYSDWSTSWGGQIDFPIHNSVLGVQNALLSQMLDNARLTRMVDNGARMPAGTEAYSIAEYFRTLTDAVWSELGTGSRAARNIDSFRRNLQRSYLERMADKMLDVRPFPSAPATPEDARSLARYELAELSGRMGRALAQGNLDVPTRAHLMESKARIDRALEASVSLTAK